MRRFLHPILWVKEDACFNSLCRYLHEVCLPAMVHRNFKSANILLDDEMNPHLSDCGIAAFTPLGVERQVKNTFINLVSFQTSKITWWSATLNPNAWAPRCRIMSYHLCNVLISAGWYWKRDCWMRHQVSAQMLGSFGYSAPEYAMSGLYTMRSDVYSFGVVLLELLTGRKPLDRSIFSILSFHDHIHKS